MAVAEFASAMDGGNRLNHSSPIWEFVQLGCLLIVATITATIRAGIAKSAYATGGLQIVAGQHEKSKIETSETMSPLNTTEKLFAWSNGQKLPEYQLIPYESDFAMDGRSLTQFLPQPKMRYAGMLLEKTMLNL